MRLDLWQYYQRLLLLSLFFFNLWNYIPLLPKIKFFLHTSILIWYERKVWLAFSHVFTWLLTYKIWQTDFNGSFFPTILILLVFFPNISKQILCFRCKLVLIKTFFKPFDWIMKFIPFSYTGALFVRNFKMN